MISLTCITTPDLPKKDNLIWDYEMSCAELSKSYRPYAIMVHNVYPQVQTHLEYLKNMR